jgi:glycine cleavage system regulatory protein
MASIESMTARIVLTVIGPDRPGLVGQLSAAIAGVSGSWQESRMAHLAGQFAGIVEVALPAASVGPLRVTLARLEGLHITVTEAEGGPVPAPARVARLSFVGHDRPGLVQAISTVLAANRVNVDELDTRTYLGAMSGITVFEAKAEVHLPEGLSLERLRSTLEEVGRDLLVEVQLFETGR